MHFMLFNSFWGSIVNSLLQRRDINLRFPVISFVLMREFLFKFVVNFLINLNGAAL